MSLALDYQTIHKTQRQDSINLLEHLSSISVQLQDVREQKNALFARLHCLSEQQQLLSTQESALLQELRVILAELAFRREQRY